MGTIISKLIKDHEDFEIRCDGKVFSLPRKGSPRYTERKLQLSDKGYLMVTFGAETCNVHRLVAEAFVPNPNSLPVVNHLDEDKTNNHYLNLEWSTHPDNVKYSLAKPVNQLTFEGRFIKIWSSASEAASVLGLNATLIKVTCRGGQTKSGGFKWEYSKPESIKSAGLKKPSRFLENTA